MTKLTSSLPKGSANGLDVLTRELVDDPLKKHAVIALLDCKSTTTDNDTGDVIPTARIRHIEVITEEDLRLAERAMRRALEKRTGKTVLPLDLEDELSEAFADLRVDPNTGELEDT